MINSKAIDLLKTFTNKEFKELGLFIRSPFFNNEIVLIKLYDALKKYYPEFKGRGFNKENIYDKIYNGKKYNDSIMRNNLSKMLSLAEQYLAIKHFKNDKFEYNLALIKELSSRNQKKLFEKVLIEESNMTENYSAKDETYFYNKLILADEKRQYELNRKSSMDYASIDYILEMQDSLIPYFLISLFKNGCYVLNSRSNLYSKEHNSELFRHLEHYLLANEEKFSNYLYLWYFYYAYKLGTSKDEKFFYMLKEMLKNKFEELSPLDRRNIYIILTNYCYIKINDGELQFSKEHFSLLKENVEKNEYRSQGNFMTHIFFMNVVIVGLEADESSWIKNFIEKYKAELDKENYNNTLNFSYAFYYFFLKEYDKALEHASRVGTDDLSYKHQLKSFYLKIYFDMNATESFYSHVDNYRHFISSEKNINLAMKETIANYINFAKRLFDIKLTREDKDFKLSKLKNEVIKSTNLINKVWLLKKIDILNDSYLL